MKKIEIDKEVDQTFFLQHELYENKSKTDWNSNLLTLVKIEHYYY